MDNYHVDKVKKRKNWVMHMQVNVRNNWDILTGPVVEFKATLDFSPYFSLAILDYGPKTYNYTKFENLTFSNQILFANSNIQYPNTQVISNAETSSSICSYAILISLNMSETVSNFIDLYGKGWSMHIRSKHRRYLYFIKQKKKTEI